ncbi:hypothetical protein EYF80_021507 [Liparis tanakae]|uniref:Uncharacterized protein n=1 Tax=Liparis tanakae TaxID=230148 RepID=A0A4Z2HTL1_9TELE|nr:hypothetical protein EYF80_021507 [Liparis tanakae]
MNNRLNIPKICTTQRFVFSRSRRPRRKAPGLPPEVCNLKLMTAGSSRGAPGVVTPDPAASLYCTPSHHGATNKPACRRNL